MKQIYVPRAEKYLFVIIFSLFILLFGAVSNTFVYESNGCKMPVRSDYHYSTDTHFSFRDSSEVNHSFLADRFHIINVTYSIGDFLLYSSAIIFILFLVLYRIEVRKRKEVNVLEKYSL
ncbi:MAG TPA: hypothetical protein VJ438_05395 [Candidatus Nanoarchaeia archaeon]|nr:hypothetical protein [Candidatus Nanoarchaeia archaeon]